MSAAKRLIQIKLPNGIEAEFETDEALAPNGASEDVELVSRGEAEETATERHFDKLVKRIRPVAEVLFDSLKELNTPQEIHLEFGVKLGGKTGIVFASAESECNFKIGLKWTNPREPG